MRIPGNNLIGPDLVSLPDPLVVPINSTFTAPIQSEEANASTARLGARIEAPYTAAIISSFQEATYDPVTDTWSVTLDTPTTEGLYNLRWMDVQAEPVFDLVIPLQAVSPTTLTALPYPPVDDPSITPSVADVAALDRTRATSEDGATSSDTFDDTTYPKGTDVEPLIAQAKEQTLGVLPETFDPRHYPRVKQAISFLSVVLLEASFFKAQQLKETSAGVETTEMLYERLYDQAVAALQTQIKIDIEQAPRTGSVLF